MGTYSRALDSLLLTSPKLKDREKQTHFRGYTRDRRRIAVVSIHEGAFLFIMGCGFVMLMESADKLAFVLAIPLVVLSLIGFHVALFSIAAPHRLGIKKDEANRLQPLRRRIGVPLLVVTAGIGIGFWISAGASEA